MPNFLDYNPALLRELNIVVVVPAYNEEKGIAGVIRSLPSYISSIVVVDDASEDSTADIIRSVADEDSRIVLLRHEKNLGVGGAMISGFKKALELDAQIVVKIDGDGQMSPHDLEALLLPLLEGNADYAKGNRFHDFHTLSQMPLTRRFGNTILSFLTKAAVGYWNLFDPCNGYVGIRSDVLQRLQINKLSPRFFFETSMLGQLNLIDAVVKDVPMPACYGNEISHLSIPKVIAEFLPRLAACFARRMLLSNFLYDFSMESVYILTGLPMLTWGMWFGITKWIHYSSLGTSAPTGTVIIPTILIILGFQLLLSALGEDIRRVPSAPISRPLKRTRRTAPGTTEEADDRLYA